jgi:hypothetical protein
MRQLILALVLTVAASLSSLGQSTAQTPHAQVAPPAHPVTEATLREYYGVCHFAVSNREALDKLFQSQQKQLPPWYPPSVWAELVQSVEDIDVVPIALPVYQKYWSDDAMHMAIRIFATPDGQAMVNKVFSDEMQQEASGDPALDARRKALVAVQAQEDAEAHKILNSMSPAESAKAEAFMRSPEWSRLNSLSGQIAQEYSAAYLAKQNEVARAVAAKHQSELQKAYQDYQTAHPQTAVSSPQ